MARFYSIVACNEIESFVHPPALRQCETGDLFCMYVHTQFRARSNTKRHYLDWETKWCVVELGWSVVKQRSKPTKLKLVKHEKKLRVFAAAAAAAVADCSVAKHEIHNSFFDLIIVIRKSFLINLLRNNRAKFVWKPNEWILISGTENFPH